MKVMFGEKTDVGYNLNNANEKAYYDKFKRCQDARDDYLLGKITAENALLFLRTEYNKYKNIQDRIIPPEESGVTLKDHDLFRFSFSQARQNQIQEIIDEIENAEAQKAGKQPGITKSILTYAQDILDDLVRDDLLSKKPQRIIEKPTSCGKIIRDNIVHGEYWLKKTQTATVRKALQDGVNGGKYQIADIDSFMIEHIRTKTGDTLRKTINKSRQRTRVSTKK
jgi:ribosomal protein L22